jgi:hypothetical protein
LLNLPNGLLDWRTGQLLPHDPAIPSTVRIPVPWNPEATCPFVDAFLASTLPEDCVRLLEEIAGYALLPDNPLHKAILFDGAGRNGKGNTLRAAHGAARRGQRRGGAAAASRRRPVRRRAVVRQAAQPSSATSTRAPSRRPPS